jgi:hypothetical protein
MKEFLQHVKKVMAQDFRDMFLPFAALRKFVKGDSSQTSTR